MAWPDSIPNPAPGREAGRQPTLRLTASKPRAPSGAGGLGVSSWTTPFPSVARTRIVWLPGVASHGRTHWTQVASEIGYERVASYQVSSMDTSTLLTPRSGAQAMPAIGTRPALTEPRGVSMRDWVRIGASLAQPSGTQ